MTEEAVRSLLGRMTMLDMENSQLRKQRGQLELDLQKAREERDSMQEVLDSLVSEVLAPNPLRSVETRRSRVEYRWMQALGYTAPVKLPEDRLSLRKTARYFLREAIEKADIKAFAAGYIVLRTIRDWDGVNARELGQELHTSLMHMYQSSSGAGSSWRSADPDVLLQIVKELEKAGMVYVKKGRLYYGKGGPDA